MSHEGWLKERRPEWSRLETIIDRHYRRGPRRCGPADACDLTDLYQSACADLARLRSLKADPQMVDWLNRLVIRAHGQIYRGVPGRSFRLGRFFLVEYPRLFRRTWKFTVVSLLLFVTSGLMAFVTVQNSPHTISDILGGGEGEFYGSKTVDDIRERFGHEGSPLLSSFVTTNNIRVALTAFALGITFSLGTVYVLVVNGAMLGGIAGAFARSDLQAEFWTVILPHGALELSAIIVAGGAGLLLGSGLWRPGGRTRVRALREEAVKAVKLAVGLIPAFIVAGVFEGFITPTDHMADAEKLVLGIAAAAVFWLYLLLGGMSRNEPNGAERD